MKFKIKNINSIQNKEMIKSAFKAVAQYCGE